MQVNLFTDNEFTSIPCANEASSFLSLLTLSPRRLGVTVIAILDLDIAPSSPLFQHFTKQLIASLSSSDRISLILFDKSRVHHHLHLTDTGADGQQATRVAILNILDGNIEPDTAPVSAPKMMWEAIQDGIDCLNRTATAGNERVVVLVVTNGKKLPQKSEVVHKQIIDLQSRITAPVSFHFFVLEAESPIPELIGDATQHLIQDSSSLALAFSTCLGELFVTTAKKTVLVVTAGEGIRINGINTSSHKTQLVPERSYAIAIDTLYVDEDRDIFVDLHIPVVPEETTQTILDVKLEFQTDHGQPQVLSRTVTLTRSLESSSTQASERIHLVRDQLTPTYDISELLERELIGSTVEPMFGPDPSSLPTTHPFSWEMISSDPKGDHGSVSVRGSWYKTMTYHILHTGGFLRLCTLRGRAYWTAQNEQGHTTPDWKIHFSCEFADLGKAWNILAALFMEMKCEIGMKVTVIDEHNWSPGQRGRELTVYIFTYHNSYRGYMQGVIPEKDHELMLGREWDEIYQAPFWFTFIREAERRLSIAGVRSRGVADGDLGLPGCRYASLRNEAFVRVPCKALHIDDSTKQVTTRMTTDFAYPPNQCGWNAARDRNPLLQVIFFLHALTENGNKSHENILE
eukprot:c7439_g1_i1.p1 GENE.c7439_g1_i1~~c7439_g1_i1.p1  ORF type:complete len:645 (-),score=154.87 c7439_g1_i1:4-1893(-)